MQQSGQTAGIKAGSRRQADMQAGRKQAGRLGCRWVHGRRVVGGKAESTYTSDRHSGRPIIFCPNEPRALMYFKNFVR